MAQFVPLKVDVATPEYATLQRKHKSEGNTIPKIFVIRADGKSLYAKSGSLPGEQLPALMRAAVAEMGRPLSLDEAKALDGINQQIKESLDKQDWKSAVSLFRKTSRLGPFGQIPSFARAASEHNLLATKFAENLTTRTAELKQELDSNERIKSAVEALQLKASVGSFPQFRQAMNELEKSVRNSCQNPAEYSLLKDVAMQTAKLDHPTASVRQRAVAKLRKLLADSPNPELSKVLDSVLKLAADSQPVPDALRMWTSNDGRFKIRATMISVDKSGVLLKKSDGGTVRVPLDRLSSEDREYVRNAKKNDR